MVELKEGELSDESIQTRFGVRIVRMDKRENGRQLLFKNVHKQVRER